jgi:hypothetical protein
VVANIFNVVDLCEGGIVLLSVVVRETCYNNLTFCDVSAHRFNQASLPGYNLCSFEEQAYISNTWGLSGVKCLWG